MRSAASLTVGLWIAACPVLADPVTVQDIVAAAEGADVVVLGEIHDNPAHHDIQAQVVEALRPPAIVFEMISAEAAATLRGQEENAPEDMAAALDWANLGWPDFSFYAPLFEAVWTDGVYGGLVDREAARAAFQAGAASVFGDGVARFGLTVPLPPEQQAAREAGQMAAHCDALPVDILPGFVEAQRLRDARLAAEVLVALDDTGGPVVVITGNGHARLDWGVPALLAQAAPEVSVFSLGQHEEDAGQGDAPFDLVTIAPAPARDDPCAAFR